MSVHVIRSTAAPVGAPLSTQIGNHWIQTTTGGHWVAIDTTTTGWYDMKTLKGLGTPGEVNTTISEGTGRFITYKMTNCPPADYVISSSQFFSMY